MSGARYELGHLQLQVTNVIVCPYFLSSLTSVVVVVVVAAAAAANLSEGSPSIPRSVLFYSISSPVHEVKRPSQALCWGSNSSGGEIFRTDPDLPLGPTNFQYDGYQVPFSGVNRPGRGVYHPPPSSAEVEERVELYL
jgi:hypothetical protein